MDAPNLPLSSSSHLILEVLTDKKGEFLHSRFISSESFLRCFRDHDAYQGAILYLSESLDESLEQSLRQVGLNLSPSFSNMHAKDTISLLEADRYPETYFLAKWTAPVKQTKRQWEIEQRILIMKPYDIDTIHDPLNLRLNHTRYTRSPSFPHRPYHPISVSDDTSELVHAAIECVSFYFERINGVIFGFLLFDPPRNHRITCKKYDFWSDSDGPDTTTYENTFVEYKRCRDRFVEKLRGLPGYLLQADVGTVIKCVLLEMILEDEMTVLSNINGALDNVELSLARDDLLSGVVDTWRNRFCCWKNLLFHTGNSINYLSSLTDSLELGDANDHNARCQWHNIPRRLQNTKRELQSTSIRIDATFQVFMSTMSIVESARAIREAETITKLTHLAFFFVPVTLVTTCFSTNIVEFKDELTCAEWVIATVIVLLLTYLFLYHKRIAQFIVQAPGFLTDMSIHRLSKIAVRWLTIAKASWRATPYLLIFAVWLGLNTGIVTGLWKLIESPVSLEAKIGISLTILCGYLIAAIIPPILRYRQQRDGSSGAIILGTVVIGILMLGGIGLGMWKLLDSQIATLGKTIASFGILCYATLMSLIPTVLARKKQVNTTIVTPDFSSI